MLLFSKNFIAVNISVSTVVLTYVMEEIQWEKPWLCKIQLSRNYTKVIPLQNQLAIQIHIALTTSIINHLQNAIKTY